MSDDHGDTSHEPSDMTVAREVARQIVADQWPDLAEVEPLVTPRQRTLPAGDLLAQLGVAPGTVLFTPDPAISEYTFTFCAETRTPDGYLLPRIARVTVDANQRIVKTTISK